MELDGYITKEAFVVAMAKAGAGALKGLGKFIGNTAVGASKVVSGERTGVGQKILFGKGGMTTGDRVKAVGGSLSAAGIVGTGLAAAVPFVEGRSASKNLKPW